MPSITTKDRVSLCRFTFDDGRTCRAPRISTSPDFCFYHAQKEAQLRANENLAEDLAYFFSGEYLSANDLNTALSCVFVAVARGDIKPRAARTLAYLAQTMFQTLHLAQNEFITSCSEKDWRLTVVKSMNANHSYRFPAATSPPAQPAPPQAQNPPDPPPQIQTPPPLQTPQSPCLPERSEAPRQELTSPTAAETRPADSSPRPNSPANHRHPPSSGVPVPSPHQT